MHDTISSPPIDASIERHHWYGIDIIGRGGPFNWSFKGIEQEDEDGRRKAIKEFIGNEAIKRGIHRIAAPYPVNFNAEKCDWKDLTVEIPLPYGATLYRGAHADAFKLGRREAFAISTGGCPIAVIYSPTQNDIWVAHCGRDSLIDRGMIEGTGTSRKAGTPESVIFTVIKNIPRPHRIALRVFIIGTIPKEEFNHPWGDTDLGKKNRKMIEYITQRWGFSVIQGEKGEGKIDMNTLISRQLESFEVDPLNIKIVRNPPQWFSTRSGPQGSNLVLVAHT